ncbi:MAG: NAD-dependent malic enzyme [Gammaproteobacteria bacterium]|nr:NAD-dependent malic enzyme [Gammaproteobacteria bacterium]NNC97756.1 NAD-dependent malic enzyme [Gammaproteobacteria bacterium]
MNTNKTGYDVLKDAVLNKSSAFTHAEREALGIRGLLPYRVNTQENQIDRVLANLRRKSTDIDKYVFLLSLQMRAEKLFYRIVTENFNEIMPLIYTPTVGQACKEFAHIFRMPKGFYITPDDKGEIDKILDNWPDKDVQVIVVTDGQRILGLGDLGANGMGIPIGKLALYTACAGIDPQRCMPVMFDVGTNNEELLNDPIYLGYPHKRLSGDAYFELMDEFITAVKKKYPNVLVQFEDFQTENAYTLLDTYRDKILSFNDDIQGTAAVSLAGLYASTRISGLDFKDLRVMFLGAGSAATGIGDLIASALVEEGLSKEEAMQRLWFLDRGGLVVKERDDLAAHKKPFAHEHPRMNLMEAIADIKPHVLIGATGTPGTFTREVVELMCELNERPTIFALSNPTSRAECTAAEAYTWSDGKAIFASGSPFPAFEWKGKNYIPGQGNNAYIFPGVGLGAVACKATRIDDEIFLTAAKALASLIGEHHLETSTLYPNLQDIREVSLSIAVKVAEKLYEQGVTQEPRPDDLREFMRAQMYDTHY